MEQTRAGNGHGGQARGFFTGLMLGGVVGAAVALLRAPQSGSDTREQIRRQASAAREKAAHAVVEARSRVEGVAGQVSHRAMEMQHHGGGALKRSRKHLARAIDEVREAAEAIGEA